MAKKKGGKKGGKKGKKKATHRNLKEALDDDVSAARGAANGLRGTPSTARRCAA